MLMNPINANNRLNKENLIAVSYYQSNVTTFR